MLKLKSNVFSEASDSLASPKLISKIISFAVVFLIIIILESIIPSIISLPLMVQGMSDEGLLDGGKISLKDSMRVALGVSAEPKVMIPSLICTIFGTVTSIVYCRAVEVRTVSSMGAVKEKFTKHYCIGLGIGAAMMSAISLLGVVCGTGSISFNSGADYKIIALYLLGFFIQGMSEEFIFRGYFMTSIGAQYSPWLAATISAAAFSAAHAANPGFGMLPCINLVLFGLFAAFYMMYTENIWGVCGIHSIWNFMQGNFYGISVSGTGAVESVFATSSKTVYSWLSGGDFGAEGSIFTTFVLCVGIGILLFGFSKRESEKS